MQMDQLWPTVPLTHQETLLYRAVRAMSTWRRTAIAHVPTQVLTPELLASLEEDAEHAYETAFTIEAVKLAYWDPHNAPLRRV